MATIERDYHPNMFAQPYVLSDENPIEFRRKTEQTVLSSLGLILNQDEINILFVLYCPDFLIKKEFRLQDFFRWLSIEGHWENFSPWKDNDGMFFYIDNIEGVKSRTRYILEEFRSKQILAKI